MFYRRWLGVPRPVVRPAEEHVAPDRAGDDPRRLRDVRNRPGRHLDHRALTAAVVLVELAEDRAEQRGLHGTPARDG